MAAGSDVGSQIGAKLAGNQSLANSVKQPLPKSRQDSGRQNTPLAQSVRQGVQHINVQHNSERSMASELKRPVHTTAQDLRQPVHSLGNIPGFAGLAHDPVQQTSDRLQTAANKLTEAFPTLRGGSVTGLTKDALGSALSDVGGAVKDAVFPSGQSQLDRLGQRGLGGQALAAALNPVKSGQQQLDRLGRQAGEANALKSLPAAANIKLGGQAAIDRIGQQGQTAKGLAGLPGAVAREVFPSGQKQLDRLGQQTQILKAPQGGQLISSGLGKLGFSPLAANAGRDVLDLPGQFLPTIQSTLRAGVAAANNDTGPAKELLSGLARPFTNPLQSFQEHPVATGLALAGGEAAVGRGIGTAGRLGVRTGIFPEGGRVDRATSIARPDVGIVPGVTDARRLGSPDVFRRAYQRNVTDRGLTLRDQHGVPIRDEHGQPVLQYQGRQLKSQLRGRTSRDVANSELARRADRGATKDELRHASTTWLNRPIAGKEAVPLMVEGIIAHPKTVVPDLEARLHELRQQQPSLSASEREGNQASIDQVTALLNDKKFLANPQQAWDAAQRYVKQQQPIQAELTRLGVLSPEQTARARLVPWATSRMGAFHSEALQHEAAKAVEAAQRNLTHVMTEGKARTPNMGALGPVRMGGPEVARARAQVRDAKTELAKLQHPNFPQGLVVRGANGWRAISNDEIHAHMKAHPGHGGEGTGRDPNTIGFYSHNQKTSNAYYQPTTKLTIGASRTRTGESHRAGLHDSSYQAMHDHLVRSQGVLNQIKGVERLANHWMIFHPEGRPFRNFDELHRHMADLRATHGDKIIPETVAMRYGFAPRDVLHGIRERIDPINADHFAQEHTRAIVSDIAHASDNAKTGGYSGLGPVVGIPKVVAKTIMSHDNLMSPDVFTKVFQAGTSLFRRTNLATNPRWLFGIALENALRLGHAVAGPVSYARGRQVLKANPEKLSELRNEMGRGHAGSALNDIHQDAKRYEDTALEGATKAIAKAMASRNPALRALAAPIKAWGVASRAVLASAHHVVENQTATALLGKRAAQDVRHFHGLAIRGIRLGDQALNAVAHDMSDPNVLSAWGRWTEEIRGNWMHLDPSTKKYIQNYSPFGLWLINSVKLLAKLPVTAPLKTGAYASAYIGTQKDREKYGQGLTLPTALRVPDHLLGGLSVGAPAGAKTKTLGEQYYTPGPAVADPLGSVSGTFMPQLSNLGNTAGGVDFRFKPFGLSQGGKSDIGDRLQIFGNQELENFAPGYRLAETIAQQGGQPFDNNTLFSRKAKPGTTRGIPEGLAKALLPIRGLASILQQQNQPGPSTPNLPPGMDPQTYQDLLDQAKRLAPTSGGLTPEEILKLAGVTR